MKKINKDYYSKLGVSSKESNLVNEELALPVGLKLSPSARPRRVEMLQEAISWPRGKNQDNRKITKLYKSGDFEVAVTLASGTGKEHMALISALLSIPVGIRLVVYTKDGVQVIN